MKIRTQLKAGGRKLQNHNEMLKVRTSLKAGRKAGGTQQENHNEALHVRTALKGGRPPSGDHTGYNHNEALRVRSTLKAGGVEGQHNENMERASDRAAVSMRRELLTTSRKDDRLDLLVVRAGLRAGKRARGRYDR
jgi:hypothetical protein